MRHRTQIYLDQAQYRWLRERARQRRGSLAGVLRELIDSARAQAPDQGEDPLIRHLLREPAATASRASSVRTLDADLYG